MKYDAIVYGPLFCDFIFTGLPEMPTLGTEIFARDFKIALGGSAIVAAGLHRLGAKVGLACDLGNDALSRLASQLLDDMGIDRHLIRYHDHELPQVTVALSFPQDRAFITRFEKPATPIDLEALLSEHSARHLHIGSFLGAFDAPDAPAIAHAYGMTISLDPGWDEDALRDARLMTMVTELDYFLPSRSELCFMMGEDDAERAFNKALTQMKQGTIIMKDGADGAIARTRTATHHMPTVQVTPVDTTGAGDAFDAGFIYALTHNHSLKDCMRYGVVAGALTTTRIGGATGTPTLEEVQQWLSKLPS